MSSLVVVLLASLSIPEARAAVAGDTVPNLVLPYRANGTIFRLHENPGQIILLEFFYHWCPHCRAGTPKIHTDIENYYAARGGNNDGVPVKVVYVNLTFEAGEQGAVDEFIRTNGLTGVLNDYSFVPFYAVGPTSGAGTPRLAVINAVTDSISHQPWQLVYTADGFTAPTTINNLRTAIDSIKGPNPTPPQLTSQLTLTTVGTGSVKPNRNGQLLTVGRKYTVTATPGVGFLFAGWTGSTSSPVAKLGFQMQHGMALQANFVANPFIPVKGAYNGLFSPETGITFDTSGFITLTLTDRGKFTGRLTVAGRVYSVSGQFDRDGYATIIVARTGTTPLTVQLHVDFGGSDQITGTVTDGTWTAELTADRAVFSATNPALGYSGKHTAVLISDSEGANARPVGTGFGTVSVTTAGALTFSATLADGTAIRHRVPLSKNGQWPLFGSLYKGQGLLLGWVTLQNRESDDLHGDGGWIRLVQPTSKLYPAGFTNDIVIVGSRYTPPAAGTRVIDVPEGVVLLSGGNLTAPQMSQVTLGTDNKVINLSSNKLTLTFTLSSGLLSGSMQTTESPVLVKFKGVLLQKQAAGWGFFLGTNESGGVYFGPAP